MVAAEPSFDDELLARCLIAAHDQQLSTLIVLNKCDLAACAGCGGGVEDALRALGLAWVRVSARTGEGLEELCARLRALLLHEHAGDMTEDRAGDRAGVLAEPDVDEVAPNARQADVLRRAKAELLALAEDAGAGLPYDILGVRLEAACCLLSELTGEIAPDAVLESIFSRFCIGK